MRSTPRKAHWLVALSTFAALSAASLHASTNPADRPRLSLLDGNRPLAFEENRGQTDPRVKYLARGNGSTLFLTQSEAVLALRGSALRIRWAEGATAPRITAEGQLPGVTNYLTGKDPSCWRTGVPSWTRVHYEEVWPGIDLVFYGNPKQLEYDVIVAPGADPGRVRLAFEGAEELRIDTAGDLVARVGGEEVRLRRPVSYQEKKGARREVESAWRLLPGSEAGFRVSAYDRTRPLVIDPVLVYSTYLGGRNADYAWDVDVDAQGNAYVAGETWSSDFPLDMPLQGTLAIQDGFVTKLTPDGDLVYSTYLGGEHGDRAFAIAVDAAGNAYVTGDTTSRFFPASPPEPQRVSSDLYVAKLDPSGSSLVYVRTFVGESVDLGWDIAVDGQGNSYVTGETGSRDFPLVNPLPMPVPGVHESAFVMKLSPTGAVLYSTWLGGTGWEIGYGIAVDAAGSAHVTGFTQSTDFPTVNALRGGLGAGDVQDGFVTRLSPDGSSMVYSTYLGGRLPETPQGIAVDAAGQAWIIGAGGSPDFPLRNPLRSVPEGQDVFVTSLSPSGTLVFSTFLGGPGDEWGQAIAVDASGAVYLTGHVSRDGFPLVEPIQDECRPAGFSCFDAFVAKLAPGGSALVFSTYLGGSLSEEGEERAWDLGEGIAVDPQGNMVVAGVTYSQDFPTENPVQPGIGGFTDAFAARIEMSQERPPDCSAAVAAPAAIWPPNGRLVPVTVSGVTDPDGEQVTVAVTAIRQDEPLTKRGQPDATGLGTSRSMLRAARAGTGDGRVYHITFTATDPQGASCTGTVTVCVPHDHGKKPACGDGGPAVDSTR